MKNHSKCFLEKVGCFFHNCSFEKESNFDSESGKVPENPPISGSSRRGGALAQSCQPPSTPAKRYPRRAVSALPPSRAFAFVPPSSPSCITLSRPRIYFAPRRQKFTRCVDFSSSLPYPSLRFPKKCFSGLFLWWKVVRCCRRKFKDECAPDDISPQIFGELSMAFPENWGSFSGDFPILKLEENTFFPIFRDEVKNFVYKKRSKFDWRDFSHCE